MFRRWLATLVVLSASLVFSVPALAQEGGSPSEGDMRLVCIDGFGCAWTVLDDSDLRLLFGDTPFIEAGGDFVPSGEWSFEYPGATMTCNGIGLPIPSSTGQASFEPVEGGQAVEVIGIAEDFTVAEAVMDRIGPGVYKLSINGNLPGSGAATFHSFLAMDSESAMRGFAQGKITSSDGVCNYTRPYTAVKVGEMTIGE